jgi:predicted ATPase
MGLHTGTPLLTEEGYVGPDVHRAARIAAAGHGGQVLVSASTAALLTGRLRDLGRHLLKDLSAPERIFQVGNEEFPPLRTLYQTNLPIPATPFLGREQELSDVRALMSRHDVHLLTLTGPGGAGKTRLAVQAAGLSSEDYPHGVWWVPLAELRHADLVLETASRIVGAKGALDEHIGDRRMLLLFDNFEQVVAAAPGVAALLSSCPDLDLLVTSREPLHVAGEREYPVPPLAPDEAVALFLARASAVKPDVQMDDAVPEICRRLDDLPLALELAAARVKALSPRQILRRLGPRLMLLIGGPRDLPERQRTLRATIEWSHELLTDEEQRLFRRLAVFRGGCLPETAEAVTRANVDTLRSLVDKSLLRLRDERYRMLETIREYAVERLEASGEADAFRRRHAEHFLALAEEAESHTGDPGSKEWLDLLDAEHDNMRAAIEWFEVMGDGHRLQQLAGALSTFWYARGHLAEGARRIEAALRADPSPTAVHARALNGATVLAQVRGDFPAARRWGEEALLLWRHLGDEFGTADSMYMLGHVAKEVPDWPAAQQRFEESLRGFREFGDENQVLLATHGVALATYKLGDRERAWALTEDVLRRARATGNERMQMASLAELGLFAVDDGRVEDALPLLVESVQVSRNRGRSNLNEVLFYLCSFARAAAIMGRPENAVTLLSAVGSLKDEMGAMEPSYVKDLNEETLILIRRQLDDAAFAAAWERGRELTFDEAVALALASAEGSASGTTL